MDIDPVPLAEVENAWRRQDTPGYPVLLREVRALFRWSDAVPLPDVPELHLPERR